MMHRISTVNASQNEVGLSAEHCGSDFVRKNDDVGHPPGVWYKVTASNDPTFTALAAFTNISHHLQFDGAHPELVVYSGNCDRLTCLDSAIVNFNIDPLVWLVNPGETYFLYVADVRTREHSLLIKPAIPVSNDRCFSAISLRIGDTVRGIAGNATLDIDMPDCQEGFPSAGMWYKVVVGPNDITRRLRIATGGISQVFTSFAVFSGNCQQLVCVNSSSLRDPIGHYDLFSVEAGKTYYIKMVMLRYGYPFNLSLKIDLDPAPQ